MNAAGEIVLEPQPHTLDILDENTVALYHNSGNKCKVLDLKSNNIYTSEHYYAQKYGGTITWQRGKGYGVIDINGNIMIPHKYRRLWRHADTSYIACNCRNKYGLLASCGNELIPFKYDYLGGEMLDRISAGQGGYWFVITGLYSLSGEELLPFEFNHIDNLGDTLDYIAVCKKREWYYVNQRGERVLL